jgi:multisubunit Na+/H+ antiporter MnhB subunit
LVGDVDFLSVVGLGLSIVLISVAFERVAKLKISSSEAINTIKVMVAMAAAITMSSWILQFITLYLLHKQQLQY